jgi:hypothetical protein
MGCTDAPTSTAPTDFSSQCDDVLMDEEGDGHTSISYLLTQAGVYNVTVVTQAGQMVSSGAVQVNAGPLNTTTSTADLVQSAVSAGEWCNALYCWCCCLCSSWGSTARSSSLGKLLQPVEVLYVTHHLCVQLV